MVSIRNFLSSWLQLTYMNSLLDTNGNQPLTASVVRKIEAKQWQRVKITLKVTPNLKNFIQHLKYAKYMVCKLVLLY